MVLHQLGKPNKAIASIRRSLECEPDNPHALNNLGNMLKLKDRFDEAADSYRAALKIDPMNVQCLNNLGIALRNLGEIEAAIDSFKQAVTVDPNMAEAHYNLANLHFNRGDHGAALHCYRNAFRLGADWRDPVFFAKIMIAAEYETDAEEMLSDFLKHHPDHEGARMQLAALRGDAVEAISEGYVADHFDRFAESFDGVLKSLGYRAPEMVAGVIADHLGAPAGDKEILDLGCGTGLVGPLIAGYKKRLVGIDLSEAMLARAAKLDCYDALKRAELQSFLEGLPPRCLDVALSADTLIYLGDMKRTFEAVSAALVPGGLFVASFEKQDEADGDYRLGISGRFRHSLAYLKRAVAEAGMTMIRVEEQALRTEGGEPVHGYIIACTR